MKLAVVVLIFAAVVACTALEPLPDATYEYLFSRFVSQHGKTYHSDEFFPRYRTFRSNLDAIRESNSQNKSYTLAMNQFGDLTQEEFKGKLNGYKHIEAPYLRSKNVAKNYNGKLADALDWVAKGAVTPVKNQGSCGSCWAFSTTGSLEGANFIKNGKLVSFSEQNLVDCSTPQGNQGCNGGLMDSAFQYVISNGIATEAAYPYTGADGTCKTFTSAFKISSFKDVTANDENALLQAVNVGPVSIAIEADSLAFQFYFGGVFDSSSCGTNLDHGVLLVGYGTDSSKDYWKVKNSWGATWGESGYIRIVRNKNMCGIAMSASYPVA